MHLHYPLNIIWLFGPKELQLNLSNPSSWIRAIKQMIGNHTAVCLVNSWITVGSPLSCWSCAHRWFLLAGTYDPCHYVLPVEIQASSKRFAHGKFNGEHDHIVASLIIPHILSVYIEENLREADKPSRPRFFSPVLPTGANLWNPRFIYLFFTSSL